MFEIFLILLCLAVYYPTIHFQIIVDDVRHADNIQRGAFDFKRFDPLTFLQCRLYGMGTFGIKHPQSLIIDHGFTLFLNIVTALLIYFAFGHNQISFWTSVLYVLNPTNTQTTIWLNGRRYAMNVIITLATILTAPWGVVFYLLTPLFQMTAILAPVALGGWYCLLVPMALFLGRRHIRSFYAARMKSIVNDDMRKFTTKRLVVVVKTFGFYVRQMLFPGRTMMIYPFLSEWGMTRKGNDAAYKLDGRFFFGLFIFALVGVGLATLQGQMRWYLAFAVLATLQWCNWITPTQLVADRYMSVANIFVMFFVSYFAHQYLGFYAPALLGCLAGYYLASLLTTMPMFKDIHTFYEYHNFHDPRNVIARKFLANGLLKDRDPMGAWEVVKRGLYHNPTDFSMLYFAGLCMQILGRNKDSEQYFNLAEQNHYLNQEPLWKDNIAKLRRNNQPEHLHSREKERRARQMAKCK